MKNIYNFLLSTPLAEQWKKIGIKRRAGVISPLFFIYSKASIGIGEIPDLKILIDWCDKTKNSILELLPLNDTGFNFRPYDFQSSFALDPIYLSLRNLSEIEKKDIEKKTKILARRFSLNTLRVNYKVKGAKLEKLWEIFLKKKKPASPKFKKFIKENKFWLNDYCLFRVLKQHHQEKEWEKWERPFKIREWKEIGNFKKVHQKEIEFQQWLQWQLFEQLRKVKDYANSKGILLKGDLPLLVSRDSADVWAHSEYFDLDFVSGAPPDNFSLKGQRWGMPSYNWKRIFADNFTYVSQRLKYTENFYDLIRIDHTVGIFRIWKIPKNEPLENKGLNGFFDPADENLWEDHGRQILLRIIQNTKMLPCAEDLGTIPACCSKVLKELGMPGICVQRWVKRYPPLSVATLSTHDTSNCLVWFGKANSKIVPKEFIKKNLEAINRVDSIFCILLLLEWLFLDDILKGNPAQYRFNLPGTVSKNNWSLRMPISLEELLNHPINSQIKEIIKKTGRA